MRKLRSLLPVLALLLALTIAPASAPAPASASAEAPEVRPLPSGLPGTQASSYRARLHLAGEYLRDARWEEALELFREIRVNHPESEKAYRGLKKTLLELKRYEELQQWLLAELEKVGEHASLLEELGTVAARQDDRDEAARRWNRILELQQYSRGSFLFVSDLMMRHRMFDEALEVYREADRRHPGKFLLRMAALHDQRFEFPEATVIYLQFLMNSPTALSVIEGKLMRIGEHEEGLGPVIDRTEAWIRDMEASAARATSDGMALDGTTPDGAGEVGREVGRAAPPDARPFATPATHIVFRKLLGDLYLEAGDYPSARDHYFRLAEESPGQSSALLVFGMRCQTDGEHAVAIEVFERIVDEVRDARTIPNALTEIGASHAALGNWDEALATWNRLIEEFPETNFALAARFETARALREGKRDPAAAEALFRELIARGVGPWGEADPQFEVAECALWRGDPETAAGIYRSIRQRPFADPTRERALYEEARAEFYRGGLAAADSLFKEVAQNHPGGLHVNDALQFSILINTNPDDPETLAEYAGASYRLRTDEPVAAIAILEALEGDAGAVFIRDETLLLLGEALRRAGEPERALAALNRAVGEAQVMDLAAEARFLRGAILAEEMADPGAALAEYEKLLVEYPETLAADRARDLSGNLSRALP